jgi:serine/threonine protein kinase
VDVGEKIGSGAFGEVRLGMMQTDRGSVKVAVKTLLAQPSADMKTKFELEAKILCAVSHENVVRIVGYSDDGPQAMMILEFLEHGDLLGVLRKEKHAITTESMLQMCLQVCRAMAHLESLKVIHRDLAARNVLVGSLSPVSVKLSDVGLARTLKGSDYYRKTSNDKV